MAPPGDARQTMVSMDVGQNTKPRMLCVAGFGDTPDMFLGLNSTPLAEALSLVPVDLPGFGGVPSMDRGATLQTLAEVVDTRARRVGAQVVMAHSVASIIATLASERPGSPLLPAASEAALRDAPVHAVELPGASYWPTIDQPHAVSEAVISYLTGGYERPLRT